MKSFLDISRRLSAAMDAATFATPAHVYNPLHYAWTPHEQYVTRFARPHARILMLGMNPGPWGMAQTGVPFGDVPSVRDWMGIDTPVGSPRDEHPKRRVEGFALQRREGSGKRLWGWAQDKFGTADAFFNACYVHNYCPLLFLHESGRNVVPEKLSREERDAITGPCDQALRDIVAALKPEVVIGIGKYAEGRASKALSLTPGEPADGVVLDRILHPSPANPLANKDWAGQVEPVFRRHGLDV